MSQQHQAIRVAVVEDCAKDLAKIVALLRGSDGFECVAACRSAQDALRTLPQSQPDIVLMDIQMPVMGGLEATALIRARESATGAHIPIIAMTAHAMAGDRDRCLVAGMDGYLSKPVDSQALFEAVEALKTPAGGAESIGSQDIFDRAGLLARLAGDEEVVQDVERLFLEDAPVRLQAIEKAVKARDAAAIRFEAHGLKGAAGSLMAPRLFEAAKALETLGAESRLDGVDDAMQSLSVEAARVLEALRRSVARERKALIA